MHRRELADNLDLRADNDHRNHDRHDATRGNADSLDLRADNDHPSHDRDDATRGNHDGANRRYPP